MGETMKKKLALPTMLSVENRTDIQIFDITVQRQPRRENLARDELALWMGERGTMDGLQLATYALRERAQAEKDARSIARTLTEIFKRREGQ